MSKPLNVPALFAVTFDTENYVGLQIFKDGEEVGDPIPMELIYNFTYQAEFTPTEEGNYLVVKSVYVDEALTTLDLTQLPGSETFRASDSGGGGGGGSSGCDLIGLIEESEELVGIIETTELIGVIEC